MKPHLKFLFLIPVGWLLRFAEILMVSAALVMGMYDPAAGDNTGVETRIFADSITVGDKFLYANIINIDKNNKVEVLPVGDKLGDASVLSGILRSAPSPDGFITFACTLAVYQPGKVEIPSFVFALTDSAGIVTEMTGEKKSILISSILPPDTSGLDIVDIKTPKKIRGPLWPYLAVSLALALLIFAGLRIRRYLGGHVRVPLVASSPAWEIAAQKLDLLKKEKHPDFGRFKLYYSELSLIIREYIEGRFEFPAVESTTSELKARSELKISDGNLYERLFMMLNRADMVKFAKAVPIVSDCESDILLASDFIRLTIPVIDDSRPETDPAAETQEVVG